MSSICVGVRSFLLKYRRHFRRQNMVFNFSDQTFVPILKRMWLTTEWKHVSNGSEREFRSEREIYRERSTIHSSVTGISSKGARHRIEIVHEMCDVEMNIGFACVCDCVWRLHVKPTEDFY